MEPTVVIVVISLLGSLLVGAILVIGDLGRVTLRFIRQNRMRSEDSEPTYQDRMTDLIRRPTSTSSEMDEVFSEMSATTKVRQEYIDALESEISNLSRQQTDLEQRVEELRHALLPAIEHFIKQIEDQNRRDAKRDYVLFGIGVVTTAVISIVIGVSIGRGNRQLSVPVDDQPHHSE